MTGISYTLNANGARTSVTEADGSTVTWIYDAFGRVMTRTGTSVAPFQFAGDWQYQADGDSSLMLLGNRYYDSETGRFISPDPIGDGDNWYAYCENNPIGAVDPSGLLPDPFDDSPAADAQYGNNLSGRGAGLSAAMDFMDYLGGWLPGYGLLTGIAGHDLFGRPLDMGDRVMRSLGAIITLIGRASTMARNGCFVAGTAVAMADGSFRAIEDIQPGDTVLSRAEGGEGKSKVEVQEVKRVFERTDIPTLTLTFSTGARIETTEEHPFFVEGEGWVPAGRLALGNAIVTRAGPAVKVTGRVRHEQTKTVYNLEVAGTHTYFVGKQSGGLWVHNNCNAWGDLTEDEIRNLQAIADRHQTRIYVGGSAASGTRRGIGTNLPIGKGPGTRSDLDIGIGLRDRGKPVEQDVLDTFRNDIDWHGVLIGPYMSPPVIIFVPKP